MAPAKTRRLDLRTTPHQAALIQQAAAHTDRTVSEFVLSAATRSAERVLAERRSFLLDSQTYEAVEAILDAPLTDTSRFERLWSRPSPFGTRLELQPEE
jgi:hypothetical protein avisC_06899